MRLSVALCTYNGEKYICEQLLSIINQDLPVQEIVICDDGSKDKTLSIVDRIAADNNQIEWIIEENDQQLGVTKNFEKAITMCSGDIIFLSDQDDRWLLNKTRSICDYFSSHPQKAVIFTDAKLIGSNGELLTPHTLLDAVGLLPNYKLWKVGFGLEILNIENRATGATMAFRKSFINQFLPFRVTNSIYRGLHDEQIALHALILNKLDIIFESLIEYRQHGTNCLGVSQNNWIFKTEKPPQLDSFVLEPIPVPEYWKDIAETIHAPRLQFLLYRIKNYSSLLGKLRLLLHLVDYIRYYQGIWWWRVFISDLSYGIL